jgi:hypothetical protein
VSINFCLNCVPFSLTIHNPELTKYPIHVLLTGDPIEAKTPLGPGLIKGPFMFRKDELEPCDPNHGIPEIFTKE